MVVVFLGNGYVYSCFWGEDCFLEKSVFKGLKYWNLK